MSRFFHSLDLAFGEDVTAKLTVHGGVFCAQERRKQQQWEVVYKHNETSQKVAARVFAQRYLADLLPSVFGSLRDGGYFYDPIERGWFIEVLLDHSATRILLMLPRNPCPCLC